MAVHTFALLFSYYSARPYMNIHAYQEAQMYKIALGFRRHNNALEDLQNCIRIHKVGSVSFF